MWFKNQLKKRAPFLIRAKRSLEDQTSLFNAQLSEIYKQRQFRHANKFCRYGKRVFCQSDEDGLTIEICKRIGINQGSFIELGVGSGIENNSLVLLSMGFSGAWIGGENLAFKIPKNSQRLKYQKAWITLDNLSLLVEKSLDFINKSDLDVLSIDLDGNDYHFLNRILSNGLLPKVVICEINGMFPPPIKFTVEYNSDHEWTRDDYQGASLMLMNDLLTSFGYKLIVCNGATGVNAFFVLNKFAELFPETPNEIEEIYVEPLHINYTGFTFPRSLKTISAILKDDT
jgi:hypothetical protein